MTGYAVRHLMLSPARASTLIAGALALSACSEINTIAPGTYTSRGGPLAGARVEVNADKSSVTITPAAGPAIKRTARAWERSRWPMLCPRGLKDTSSEVLDLGPDPIVMGATRVERPVLVANCVKKPIVELRPLGADGRPAAVALEAER